MADLDLERKMVSPDKKLHVTVPEPFDLSVSSPISSSSSSAAAAYELYLRLPELKTSALQAIEITFRLILTVASDTRPYINRREWTRRLDSLVTSQIKIVASLCEDDEDDVEHVPAGNGWSSTSLLSEIATCRTTESIGQKILCTVENEMRWCKYTLGLGEPNLTGKPYLQYDAVCRPEELHSLKNNPYADHIENQENQTLYTIHQILESWIHSSRASSDVYLLETIWNLLSEVEDLHILMDPEDFLKVKKQLKIKSTSQNDAFCFRSKGLVEMAKMSKELRQKVPAVLQVEVDLRRSEVARSGDEALLEEDRIFFGYQKLAAAMMGSAEANANRTAASHHESCDSLTQVFMEPTYYPSLDAAKTFLGEFWSNLVSRQ
ncbi:hypothetical protein Bca52824_000057 [Brassica carinata]|uniref:Uncharacterized protein n=1 Tax=Brassica carinata TaxID=52824 RepID=A0A8X7WGJ3_BRACI|nr:hypothetical protein Bca52824_000057 [Brassica carinata]